MEDLGVRGKCGETPALSGPVPVELSTANGPAHILENVHIVILW